MQKLVFLTKENPFPPASGAHIRDAHLIQIFRETMEVEILCFTPENESGRPVESAMRKGDEATPPGVRLTRIRKSDAAIWKRAIDPLRPEVQTGYCEAMAAALRARAEPGKILWLSRLGMANYLELAKKLGYRTVLDQHQVETQVLWNNGAAAVTRAKTAVRGLGGLVQAAQCGYFEGRACRQSDAVVATSDLDASRLLRLSPGAPVHVIPHAIDCARYAPLRALKGRSIFFSGSLNYTPNIEGLSWFISEVHPKLKSALGTACPRLVVAGSNPLPEAYRLLDRAGADLHADPASLLTLLAEAAVVIVPARSGRSMRFKVLEAMASGRAVVATPRGAEGLVLAPGYDIWIAEAADKFASAVVRLIENPELRSEIGAHASQTTDARYDWKHTRFLLEALFQRLGKPAPAAD